MLLIEDDDGDDEDNDDDGDGIDDVESLNAYELSQNGHQFLIWLMVALNKFKLISLRVGKLDGELTRGLSYAVCNFRKPCG